MPVLFQYSPGGSKRCDGISTYATDSWRPTPAVARAAHGRRGDVHWMRRELLIWGGHVAERYQSGEAYADGVRSIPTR